MMFVATFGKIPLFLLFLLSRSDSSSSPVLGEAMLPSGPSPAGTGKHGIVRHNLLLHVVLFTGIICLVCLYKKIYIIDFYRF